MKKILHRALRFRKTAALALCLLVLGISARAVTYPEATESFYVADFAGVLSGETADYIIAENNALYQACGAQIVIVTQEFLSGERTADYSYELFNRWGVGSSEKNNGVLLLLATGEEDYWMQVGAGLEELLTGGEIDELLYTCLEPYFAVGDYDRGVYETFCAVEEVLIKAYGLSGTYEGPVGYPEENGPNEQESYGGGLLSLLVGGYFMFVLIVIVAVLLIFRPRRRRIYRSPYMGSPYIGGPYFGNPYIGRYPYIGGGLFRRGAPPPPPGGSATPPPKTNGGSSMFGQSGGGYTRGGGAGRSSFGGSRSSSGSSRSSFGGSRSSFGGGRSSFGGSRGGGGHSRGGGGGRRR